MSDFKPPGIQSLVPYVFVRGIPEYLQFVRAAFGIESGSPDDDDPPRGYR